MTNRNWKPCRKKPIIVHFREPNGQMEIVHTLEGIVWAHLGKHFVMKGAHEELYVIDIGLFFDTYDILNDESGE
jgi:hypothetical protein